MIPPWPSSVIVVDMNLPNIRGGGKVAELVYLLVASNNIWMKYYWLSMTFCVGMDSDGQAHDTTK